MTHPFVRLAAATVLLASLAAHPLQAAEPEEWPWIKSLPQDPALALLRRVKSVAVEISDEPTPVVAITVEAIAPRPGFSELQLVYRLGERDDKKFEFDARGRPPVRQTEEDALSPVTIQAAYRDAPLESIREIEIHAADNCLRYSIADGQTAECKPMPALTIDPVGEE